jgi:membrane protein YdbS with pleckstrin-like domain
MTNTSGDRVISKYQPKKAVSRAAIALAFLVIGIVSVAGIIYELYHPDFYVETHRIRYAIAGVLGTMVTIYIIPSVAYYAYALFSIMTKNENALLLHRNTIIIGKWPRVLIDVADITSVSLKPYDRAFGRPERLRITTKTGLVRDIRCDILDRSGADLVREISELAHTPLVVAEPN